MVLLDIFDPKAPPKAIGIDLGTTHSIVATVKDERPAALDWLRRHGDPYRQSGFDQSGRLGLDLGVYGAPETYLLDASGVVRYRHVGVVNEDVWRTVLEPMYLELKKGAVAP